MHIYGDVLKLKANFCMNANFKELLEDVFNEQKNIDQTVLKILDLQKRLATSPLDSAVEPALGTYLMNFYNGIENILKRISKVYYVVIVRGENWHKELLDVSFNPPEGKAPVFSKATVVALYRYKNFRHRFVSGYGFQLKAEKMADLIENVEPLWVDIKKQLDGFLQKLL